MFNNEFLHMLDISTSLTIFCILWLVITIFSMIPSISWGLSDRIQKRGHVIGLMLLFWALFQSTLSLNRWYMDRTAGWFHHAFPYFFMAIAMILLFATPRGKEFAKHIHPRYLLIPQWTRLGWVLIAYFLIQAQQLPEMVFILGVGVELFIAIPALYLYLNLEKTNPTVIRAFHILSIVVTTSELIIGYGSVPSSVQTWSILQPNFAFQHFPFSLVPAVVFPIYLFGNIHGLIFPKVQRG